MNASGKCEICSAAFVVNHKGPQTKRFCSKRCASTSFNRKQTEAKKAAWQAQGSCKHCGKGFEQAWSARGGRRRVYCSDNCEQLGWAADHPDVIKARRKVVYARDGARIRAKTLNWQQENPEKKLAKQRDWSKTEKGRLTGKASTHRRLARKHNAPGSFTRLEFAALCKATGCVCLACQRQFPLSKLEADHIVALSNGGHNGIGNIQPLCRSCNAEKGDETMNWLTMYALEGVVLNDPAQYGVAA